MDDVLISNAPVKLKCPIKPYPYYQDNNKRLIRLLLYYRKLCRYLHTDNRKLKKIHDQLETLFAQFTDNNSDYVRNLSNIFDHDSFLLTNETQIEEFSSKFATYYDTFSIKKHSNKRTKPFDHNDKEDIQIKVVSFNSGGRVSKRSNCNWVKLNNSNYFSDESVLIKSNAKLETSKCHGRKRARIGSKSSTDDETELETDIEVMDTSSDSNSKVCNETSLRPQNNTEKCTDNSRQDVQSNCVQGSKENKDQEVKIVAEVNSQINVIEIDDTQESFRDECRNSKSNIYSVPKIDSIPNNACSSVDAKCNVSVAGVVTTANNANLLDQANKAATVQKENEPREEYQKSTISQQNDECKAWAQLSNRPRRACTLKTNYQELFKEDEQVEEIQAEKKDTPPLNSTPVNASVSLLNDAKRKKPETDGKERSVEELVVNCDPFNISSNMTSTSKKANMISNIMPVLPLKIVGNKVYLPISRYSKPPPPQSKPLTTTPQTLSVNTVNSISSKPQVISKTLVNSSIKVNSTAETNSGANGKVSGKSLGKVLLINSVPFLIRDGNKIHLPMVSEKTTNTLSNVKTVQSKSQLPSTSSKTCNTINVAYKPKELPKSNSSKPIIKEIKIEDDSDDDCKEKVEKEIRVLQQKVTPSTTSQPKAAPQSITIPAGVNQSRSVLLINGPLAQPPKPMTILANTGTALQTMIRNQSNANPISITSKNPTGSNIQLGKVITNGNTCQISPVYTSKKQMFSSQKCFRRIGLTYQMNGTGQSSVSNTKTVSSTNATCASQQSSRSIPNPSQQRTMPTSILSKTSHGSVEHLSRKRSKAQFLDQLRKNTITQMVDPLNQNIILLRNNITNSNNIIGYKCNIVDCTGFISPKREKLFQHIRCRHNCIKPYRCVQCPKTFAIESELEKHRRSMHVDIQRPFNCTVEGCSKRFKQKQSLKGHLALHFYERPFVCHVKDCADRFTYSYELKQHLQDEHQIVLLSGPSEPVNPITD